MAEGEITWLEHLNNQFNKEKNMVEDSAPIKARPTDRRINLDKPQGKDMVEELLEVMDMKQLHDELNELSGKIKDMADDSSGVFTSGLLESLLLLAAARTLIATLKEHGDPVVTADLRRYINI